VAVSASQTSYNHPSSSLRTAARIPAIRLVLPLVCSLRLETDNGCDRVFSSACVFSGSLKQPPAQKCTRLFRDLLFILHCPVPWLPSPTPEGRTFELEGHRATISPGEAWRLASLGPHPVQRGSFRLGGNASLACRQRRPAAHQPNGVFAQARLRRRARACDSWGFAIGLHSTPRTLRTSRLNLARLHPRQEPCPPARERQRAFPRPGLPAPVCASVAGPPRSANSALDRGPLLRTLSGVPALAAVPTPGTLVHEVPPPTFPDPIVRATLAPRAADVTSLRGGLQGPHHTTARTSHTRWMPMPPEMGELTTAKVRRHRRD